MIYQSHAGWERKVLIEILGNECANCGAMQKLELDHITPLSWGGGNQRNNIQVLCEKCHSEKTKKDMEGRIGKKGRRLIG